MTKWKITRLPNVDDKLNFSWEKFDESAGSKWDWKIIEDTAQSMKIGEEKIVEIV